jgi:hypothetical protein
MPNLDRIDFISAYCDRWCERCRFTTRCSTFAVEAATAMCGGNFEEALELAVGRPHPESNEEAPAPDWWSEIDNTEPTAAEIAEYQRREAEREARLEQLPVATQAREYSRRSHEWLAAHSEQVIATADDLLKESLAIVGWDSHLIDAKLHRALVGRDEHLRDGDADDHPVQNDWNGSAKVASISIERSTQAWRVIAAATHDPAAAMLADSLVQLGVAVERAFPNARAFIRPGFDEPGR